MTAKDRARDCVQAMIHMGGLCYGEADVGVIERAILAAEAEATERAAKICEEIAKHYKWQRSDTALLANECAAKIRKESKK